MMAAAIPSAFLAGVAIIAACVVVRDHRHRLRRTVSAAERCGALGRAAARARTDQRVGSRSGNRRRRKAARR